MSDCLTNDGRKEILSQAAGLSERVTFHRPMSGGMDNQVEEWFLNEGETSVIAKIAPQMNYEVFAVELDTLQYYESHTRFPVPKGLGIFRGSQEFPMTILFMEKIPGDSLGDALLSRAERDLFEVDLATHVAELHSVKRDTYGSAVREPAYATFLDYYGPVIRAEYEAIGSMLDSGERRIVESVLNDLDNWLPETQQPTLIHGDLWATNIMLGRAPNGKVTVSAFIDVSANFRNREQELAYLLIFNTAGRAFFDAYQNFHPIEPGFDRRCRVYWLNTWMRHVRKFGSGYLPAVRRTIQELGIRS